MATAKQQAANKQNAQKSTGPKTQRGKDKSKMNALVHGLRTDLDVIQGESREEFVRERQGWLDGYVPQDLPTLRLVENAMKANWRLMRIQRIENALYDKIAENEAQKFDEMVRRTVKDARAMLRKNSIKAYDLFNNTYHGLDALQREWNDLEAICVELGDWCSMDRHHDRLCRLLDVTPRFTSKRAEDIRDLSLQVIESSEFIIATRGSLTPEHMMEADDIIEPFREVLRECRDACQKRRDTYMPTHKMREIIKDSAILNSGAAGERLLKYEATCERSLNNALRELRTRPDYAAELDEHDDNAGTSEQKAQPVPNSAAPSASPLIAVDAITEIVGVAPVSADPAPAEAKAEVVTNEPKLNITLLKDETCADPLSGDGPYHLKTPLTFTETGELTAFCELEIQNRAASYDRDLPSDQKSPAQLERERQYNAAIASYIKARREARE